MNFYHPEVLISIRSHDKNEMRCGGAGQHPLYGEKNISIFSCLFKNGHVTTVKPKVAEIQTELVNMDKTWFLWTKEYFSREKGTFSPCLLYHNI